MLTLDRIYQAAHTLKGVARKTDLIPAPTLAPDCTLYLKTENLQVTGSFKVRGAYFKMSTLTDEEKTHGVVACSAGNHAQGVALAAQRMGVPATVFIPSIAPLSKIEAARRLGADVRLVDGVYDDAFQAACAYRQTRGSVFLHPFDDEDVIAGQGTIGLELLEQLGELDAVVVPVGGGGLISGIAFAVKKLHPACQVYGVQAAGADSMCRSLQEQTRISGSNPSTFADGIAVNMPGEMPFALCAQYVDKVVTVTDDETATAILALMEQQKLVAEGAGGVAVAAVMFGKLPIAGKRVCAIVSGGNIDVNILSRVINRGLLSTGRLSALKIKMCDRPGELEVVSAIIARTGANVIKVMHNPAGEHTDITGCFLHISMETRSSAHFEEICTAIRQAGFTLA